MKRNRAPLSDISPLVKEKCAFRQNRICKYILPAILIAACLTTHSHACDLCGFSECWFWPDNQVSASDDQSDTETPMLRDGADALKRSAMARNGSPQNESAETTQSGPDISLWPDSGPDTQTCSITLHENGTLEVIGSNESDWLEVNLIGRFVIVTAVYGIDEPRAFWLNRIDKGFALSDVQKVILRGKASDDILVNIGWLPSHQFGDEGNDEMNGGSGQDIMHGGSGDDDIYGQDGPDYLLGGPGKDLLDGARDFEIVKSGHISSWQYYPVTDYLRGGSGRDLFINYKKTAPGTGFSYPSGTMQDVILDFNSGQDQQVHR